MEENQIETPNNVENDFSTAKETSSEQISDSSAEAIKEPSINTGYFNFHAIVWTTLLYLTVNSLIGVH